MRLWCPQVEQLFKPWGAQVLAGALDEDLAVAQVRQRLVRVPRGTTDGPWRDPRPPAPSVSSAETYAVVHLHTYIHHSADEGVFLLPSCLTPP